MRKKWMIPALLSVLFLVGCAEGQDSSILVIDKHKAVKSYIVEDFSASYYDVEELRNSVTEDISVFNEGTQEPLIELIKLENEEGILRATIEYQDTKAYEEFNEETLFVGSIEEAIAEGYRIEADFYSIKDLDTKLSLADVQNEETHIIIFSEPVSIKAPKKVLYVSEGLQKGDSSKKVTVTDDTKEIYYIIYE